MEHLAALTEERVEKIRRETPGIAGQVHLNNAGAALMPDAVVNAVIGHISREAARGGYEAQAEAAEQIEDVYTSVATLVGSAVDEIALADSATLAWQRVFYSLPFASGDRILTTRGEFAANYVAYLQARKWHGVEVKIIPDDSSGALDTASLEKMIDERVRLISITWVPSNGGLINPAAEVGRIARELGITYLLDACQAAGQIPIDVDTLGCDVLTATGRKFLRGPRGTGFAYVRRALLERLEPAFIDLFGAPWVGPEEYRLREDARRFETWENNYASRLGLGAAVDYALGIGLEAIADRNHALTGRLRSRLLELPGVHLQDKGTEFAAIASITHDVLPASTLKTALSGHGFNVSVSPPSTTPLDAHDRGLPDVLRISPHYYNTFEEIDRFADALAFITT
ncbi:aminotransferase class V-fold PLP-dependent enzyme [Arthrobacter bambusae]